MMPLSVQVKGIRRVRTPEGAEHFGQPIGTVIVRDVVPTPSLGSQFMENAVPKSKNRNPARDTGIKHVHRYEVDGMEVALTTFPNNAIDAKVRDKRTGRVFEGTFPGQDFDQNLSNVGQLTQHARSERPKMGKRRKSGPPLVKKFRPIDPTENHSAVSDAMGVDVGTEHHNPTGRLTRKAHAVVNEVIGAHEDRYPGMANFYPYVKVSDTPDAQHSVGISSLIPMDDSARQSIFGMPPAPHDRAAILLAQSLYGDTPTPDMPHKIEVSSAHGSFSLDTRTFADKHMGGDIEAAVMVQTLTHEIGHTVGYIVTGHHDALAATRSGDERWADSEPKITKMLRDYGVGNYDPDTGDITLDPDETRRNVSQYAASDIHELLAEVWLSYQLSEHPSKFVQDLGGLMEQVLEDYLEEVMQ